MQEKTDPKIRLSKRPEFTVMGIVCIQELTGA